MKDRTREFVGSSAIFRNYAHRAKRKSVDFDMTRDDFHSLIYNACSYCGDAELKNKRKFGSKGDFVRYNGLDKIDPLRGYHIDNVAVCCRDCNEAKGTKSVAEFIIHIEKLWRNLRDREVLNKS